METQQTYKEMQEIESELSSFLKRVRQREEEHYRLLDYTSKLIAKRDQPQESVIQADQISKVRQFFKQKLAVDSSHQQKDFALAAKCESTSFQEQDSLLTRRVAARILQVTHNAIELRGQSNDYYSTSYTKFKCGCLKGLAEVKNNPAWVIRITNRYLSSKMQVQLERLRQVLGCLEKYDFQGLGRIRNHYYSQLKRKELQHVSAFRQEKQERAQVQNQSQRSPKKEPNENPEKDEKKQIFIRAKGKSSKDEEKQSLKIKKFEVNKLKKLAVSLSEVMDICREDLLQQLAPDNKVWQTRRMLHDLVNRNKINQNYINIFRQKQPLYKQKLSRPLASFHAGKINRCQSLEEELLEKSEKEEETTAFTTKDIRISEPILHKKEIPHITRYERKEINKLVPKSGHLKKSNPRQRSTLNNIQQTQKIKKQRQIFSSQKQMLPQQEFMQINFKVAMPMPKARFPQINSRVVSVDKTQRIKKEQLVRTKLELKSTGNNFFEEIEKRISKFCQMKRNLMI